MITDKKNQHYVPKFYLKHFSFEKNEKEIGVFNLERKLYIKRGPLKSQGSKNFFYGRDGVIEDKLSDVEGNLAACINKILNNVELPVIDMKNIDYIDFIKFVVLTTLRNPSLIETFNDASDFMSKGVINLPPRDNQLRHEETINKILSMVGAVAVTCLDLEFKLLINGTKIPFIMSDFPILKYNQFLEKRKWNYGKTAFGNTGIQIFVPLSPRICVLLYDSQIYKVGHKNKNFINIKIEDVNKLNLLQFLNCSNVVLFNDQITEAYIKNLHQKSLIFNRANQPIKKVTDDTKPGEKKSELRMFGTTDCEINLSIEGVKYTSYALGYQTSKTVSEIRPYVRHIREMEKDIRASNAIKNKYGF